jgi:hypothetical protein
MPCRRCVHVCVCLYVCECVCVSVCVCALAHSLALTCTVFGARPGGALKRHSRRRKERSLHLDIHLTQRNGEGGGDCTQAQATHAAAVVTAEGVKRRAQLAAARRTVAAAGDPPRANVRSLVVQLLTLGSFDAAAVVAEGWAPTPGVSVEVHPRFPQP